MLHYKPGFVICWLNNTLVSEFIWAEKENSYETMLINCQKDIHLYNSDIFRSSFTHPLSCWYHSIERKHYGSQWGPSTVSLPTFFKRNSYRFGTTWEWVIADRTFIFEWTIPLRNKSDITKHNEDNIKKWFVHKFVLLISNEQCIKTANTQKKSSFSYINN